MEIPEALLLRLEKLPVPLVDTAVTVIERSLSSYEAQTGQARAIREQPASSWGSRGYRRTKPLIHGRRRSCWGSERLEFPGPGYNSHRGSKTYLGSMHSMMQIGEE